MVIRVETLLDILLTVLSIYFIYRTSTIMGAYVALGERPSGSAATGVCIRGSLSLAGMVWLVYITVV